LLVAGLVAAPAAKAAQSVDNVALVNPLIGTTGAHATEYGGMVPNTSPPFAMTKWTPQTRENRISVNAYHYNDSKIHGFQGSHQPAIWMGEWGQVVVMPGAGTVKPRFADRGLSYSHEDKFSTPWQYSHHGLRCRW
jgi:putative alpha-1,2-mannosidase